MNPSQFWGGGGAAPYEIEQSLRFDGSSYLLWTPSSTGDSVRKWTISVWVKQNYATGSTAKYMISAGPSTGSDTAIYPYTYDLASDISGKYYFVQGDGTRYVRSVPSYRDESAWYHMVFQSDADNATTGDKLKIFVNGERIATESPQNAPIAQNTYWNSTNQHKIARIGSTTNWTGYMAEFHSVDNQLVAPDQFGEYDDNGVWRPIEYTGTYGSNGFYLKFDPSATNGIGHDHSGNGNNWTPTGFTTSGTGTDVLSDTPTNNFCTLNPLFQASNLTNGNLEYNRVSPNIPDVGTIALPANQGKWYWEIVFETTTGDQSAYVFGVVKTTLPWGTVAGSYSAYQHASDARRAYGILDSGPSWSWSVGDVLGIGIDMTNGDFRLYKNGTLISNWTGAVDTNYAHYPFINGYYSGDKVTMNFGQRDFEQTPPTGHVALCTANLPAPDIADGSKYFTTLAYSGTSTTDSKVIEDSQDNNWAPDFVWLKKRNSGANHMLYDRVRGASKSLRSNTTGAEVTGATNGDLTAFTPTGFTLNSGNDVNASGNTYVAWNWLASNTSGSSNTAGSITSTVSANPTAGFSIVTYTGTASAATVGHGLGVSPSMIIVKNRDQADKWAVYHKDAAASPATVFLSLNETTAATVSSAYWNNTTPTSFVFTVGQTGPTNQIGENYVAYCFAEVEGYSKFGSYVGNGNADGPLIYTGFRVSWLMVKRYAANANDWVVVDASRNTYNPLDNDLYPNLPDDEFTGSAWVDFLSNGFKLRANVGRANGSGDSYIFIAFAEHPTGGDGVSPATAR